MQPVKNYFTYTKEYKKHTLYIFFYEKNLRLAN